MKLSRKTSPQDDKTGRRNLLSVRLDVQILYSVECKKDIFFHLFSRCEHAAGTSKTGSAPACKSGGRVSVLTQRITETVCYLLLRPFQRNTVGERSNARHIKQTNNPVNCVLFFFFLQSTAKEMVLTKPRETDC